MDWALVILIITSDVTPPHPVVIRTTANMADCYAAASVIRDGDDPVVRAAKRGYGVTKVTASCIRTK